MLHLHLLLLLLHRPAHATVVGHAREQPQPVRQGQLVSLGVLLVTRVIQVSYSGSGLAASHAHVHSCSPQCRSPQTLMPHPHMESGVGQRCGLACREHLEWHAVRGSQFHPLARVAFQAGSV